MNANNGRGSVVNITLENGDVKTFLPPGDFDSLYTPGRDDVALRTIELAPWWEKDFVFAPDHTGLAAYAHTRNYFPRLIHVDRLRSWMWQRAFCVRDRDLRVSPDQFVRSVREEFVAS